MAPEPDQDAFAAVLVLEPDEEDPDDESEPDDELDELDESDDEDGDSDELDDFDSEGLSEEPPAATPEPDRLSVR